MKQTSSYMQEKYGSLSAFIGERLRWHRESRKLRQDEVAALARRWGFDWTQATVAALEGGRRQLSLEEFLVLGWIAAHVGPEAAKRGDGRPVELAALFPGSIGNYVRLNRRLLVDAASLGRIVSGQAEDYGLALLDVPPGARANTDFESLWHAGIAENRAVLDCLWPDRGPDRGDGGPLRDLLEAAHADKLADAEQRAARRLRTIPLAVAAAARKRWGRSFTEERDRRVAAEAPADATTRTLQALRGHVTRALLEDLRPTGIEGLKVKRAARTKAKKRAR